MATTLVIEELFKEEELEPTNRQNIDITTLFDEKTKSKLDIENLFAVQEPIDITTDITSEQTPIETIEQEEELPSKEIERIGAIDKLTPKEKFFFEDVLRSCPSLLCSNSYLSRRELVLCLPFR